MTIRVYGDEAQNFRITRSDTTRDIKYDVKS